MIVVFILNTIKQITAFKAVWVRSSVYLSKNVCCGYSKEPSHSQKMNVDPDKTATEMIYFKVIQPVLSVGHLKWGHFQCRP